VAHRLRPVGLAAGVATSTSRPPHRNDDGTKYGLPAQAPSLSPWLERRSR
jgi:hypothetical protein